MSSNTSIAMKHLTLFMASALLLLVGLAACDNNGADKVT